MSSNPFYEQPILNSPYHPPTRHHALDEDGRPLDRAPMEGRRRSKYVTPVPKARRRKRGGTASQAAFDLDNGAAGPGQGYNPAPIINEIRGHLETWRALPNQASWGVTPATAKLLSHWRSYEFEGLRPFFCQVEAVETMIWLTEVARGRRQYAHIWKHLEAANEQANPELFRLAMKMATGAGKTTVMAMLIAWQTANAVRSPGSNLFSRGFLIVTPGITIRDRLCVLLPSDPENYYETRNLVPPDMVGDVRKAKVEIVNYRVFKRRETDGTNKVSRGIRAGWRNESVNTLETEGEMLKRACGDLLQMKQVVVINDEAHHCYRERPDTEEEADLKGEEKDEAKQNNEAAWLWISGIEALKRKVGLRGLYDLSATPFFLRGLATTRARFSRGLYRTSH